MNPIYRKMIQHY